jgi:hypothetical protein
MMGHQIPQPELTGAWPLSVDVGIPAKEGFRAYALLREALS